VATPEDLSDLLSGDALPPPGARAFALASADDTAGGDCTGSAIEGQPGQHSHAAALRSGRIIGFAVATLLVRTARMPGDAGLRFTIARDCTRVGV
jgi:hypothetical protein